jgi:hypothetical protein
MQRPHTSTRTARRALHGLLERVRCLHPARRSEAGPESGAVLVEFALILPLLVLIMMIILEFGKVLNYWQDETHLANQAARLAAVDNNPGGGTLCSFIKGQDGFPSELKDGATVSIEYPDGTAVGGRVVAKVRMPYSWLPIIRDNGGVTTSTITGSATMRLEKAATSGGCSS